MLVGVLEVGNALLQLKRVGFGTEVFHGGDYGEDEVEGGGYDGDVVIA